MRNSSARKGGGSLRREEAWGLKHGDFKVAEGLLENLDF
jgi:hypothetical protein